jgi:hypothetical protein
MVVNICGFPFIFVKTAKIERPSCKFMQNIPP